MVFTLSLSTMFNLSLPHAHCFSLTHTLPLTLSLTHSHFALLRFQDAVARLSCTHTLSVPTPSHHLIHSLCVFVSYTHAPSHILSECLIHSLVCTHKFYFLSFLSFSFLLSCSVSFLASRCPSRFRCVACTPILSRTHDIAHT